jgi:hypothetical protein
MPLTLSAEEQRLFAAALAALVSPVDSEQDDERWGRAVAGALGALVGAGSAVVVLQCGRVARAFSDGTAGDTLGRLTRPPGEPAVGAAPPGPQSAGGVVLRTRAWCRRAPRAAHAAGGTRSPAAASTADDATPGEWYDAVGLTAGLGLPGANASVACLHRRVRTAGETHRELELLRLLLPAFAAAARERLFAGAPPAALGDGRPALGGAPQPGAERRAPPTARPEW